jgi:MOSC domain-containing protein YiiM
LRDFVVGAGDTDLVPDSQVCVVAVCRDEEHRFSKVAVDEIQLLPGLGVSGDAHLGATVQHRSRVAVDPTQPNLRQVHLVHAELFAQVAEHGFDVDAGQLGENMTTRGLDLLALPRGAVLRIGNDAVVEITGLRNPCQQINTFQPGLLKQVLTKDSAGELVRRAGVMGVVLAGGVVRPGNSIVVQLPPAPHQPLERV